MAITEDLSPVTVTLAGGQATIGVAGELDVHSVRALHRAAASTAAPHVALAIDLGEVTFISAAGLQALASLAKIAHEGGREFTIQQAPSRLKHLLVIAGVIEGLSLAEAAQ